MAKIIHFDDAPAPGGVTRVVEMLIDTFGGEFCRAPMSHALQYPTVGQADVLVVHASTAWQKLPYLAALRLRNRSCKLILVEHHYTRSFEQMHVLHKSRFRTLLRSAYGIADRVVSVSKGQALWIREARLVADHKLVVIPCVVDLTRFEQLALPVPHSGPLRLGAIGRLHAQKGFEILIEAMLDIVPETATLEIAGSGPLELQLKAAAQNLSHVTFRRWTDPADFYASVDAIVMPSRWEPGAVACWESRAAGRPLIVSDVDGLPEQVPHEIGFITAKDDAASLARAIKLLAISDRPAMSRAARRSVADAFERASYDWRSLLIPGNERSLIQDRAHRGNVRPICIQ